MNLLDKEKLTRILEEFEEAGHDSWKDEEEEEISPDSPESLSDSELHDHGLELMISGKEESSQKKLIHKPVKDKEKPEENTIKDIVDNLNRKFRIQQKGLKDLKGLKRSRLSSEYLKEEFFNNAQYGIDLPELFSYLNTKSSTDVYKAFYDQSEKRTYNLEHEHLSKQEQEKIVRMTKLARHMGYKGDTEYCTHEQLDANTKEKWALIRNICFVHTLTMLRYDLSLS